jgi:hypothetical protein
MDAAPGHHEDPSLPPSMSVFHVWRAGKGLACSAAPILLSMMPPPIRDLLHHLCGNIRKLICAVAGTNRPFDLRSQNAPGRRDELPLP